MCANIFTPLKVISVSGLAAFRIAARDARISGREDSTLPRGSYEAFSRSGFEPLAATVPWQRRARWEFPAEFALQQAMCGESQQASRQRSRSAKSQIRETLFPCRLDCAQRRGLPAAAEPTSGAHSGTLPHSCRPLHKRPPPAQTAPHLPNAHRRSNTFGVKSGSNPAKGGQTPIERAFSAVLFALCSPHRHRPIHQGIIWKCKLLLHLGNFRAFFIDNGFSLALGFLYRHFMLTIECGFSSPRVNLWYLSHGLCLQEHVCSGSTSCD